MVNKLFNMKLKYILMICAVLLFICAVSAETYTPETGIFAFKEVENTTVNGVNFTIPAEYKLTFENDTCKEFKHGKDKLKISVVKNAKIKKVKNTKKVKAGKTYLGSTEGYLIDKNSSSYTFSYKEGEKLVTIKSKDLSIIMGVMGKD